MILRLPIWLSDRWDRVKHEKLSLETNASAWRKMKFAAKQGHTRKTNSQLVAKSIGRQVDLSIFQLVEKDVVKFKINND